MFLDFGFHLLYLQYNKSKFDGMMDMKIREENKNKKAIYIIIAIS